ncbi:MAG TPA: trigger factor, partial [bacterium]|nr:trigger factor [bacterium]
MEIQIESVSELGRELFFRIEPEPVFAEREKIVEEFRRQAEIEGFRKGKAPACLVETRYGQAIEEQLLKKLIPAAYLEGIRQHNLAVITDPEISEVKLDREGLRFKVYVEVKPEVSVKKYLGLTLKKVEPEPVTDEMVDQILKEWEKRPELAVSIIDPEKRRAWRQRIREQLETMARNRARAAEEKQIWDQLLQEARFPVPEKLVRERARHYTEEELKRQNLQGKSEKEIRRLAEEIFEKVKPKGEEDVRKYFILEKVAELEGVGCNQEELNARIQHIARVVGEPEEEVRQKLEKAGRLEELQNEIRLDKTFGLI